MQDSFVQQQQGLSEEESTLHRGWRDGNGWLEKTHQRQTGRGVGWLVDWGDRIPIVGLKSAGVPAVLVRSAVARGFLRVMNESHGHDTSVRPIVQDAQSVADRTRSKLRTNAERVVDIPSRVRRRARSPLPPRSPKTRPSTRSTATTSPGEQSQPCPRSPAERAQDVEVEQRFLRRKYG